MDKLGLTHQQALPVSTAPAAPERKRTRVGRRIAFLALGALTLLALQSQTLLWGHHKVVNLPVHAQETLDKCRNLHITPAPPRDFHQRTSSDRFAPGTPPVLIRNATIWTGRADGEEVVHGDLLLDRGLIKAIGRIPFSELASYGDKLQTYDAQGGWVTPGIVDMHSHLGVYSAPALSGASDGNSRHGPVLPWLRSLDGLNTHDDAYALSVSGGTTTALVLPGSANAIGGQAFPIKLRPTKQRSAISLLLEPHHSINGTKLPGGEAPRWRHMKHACGENPSRVYGNTRMDNIWAMRQGYEKARQIKVKQDEYCAAALKGDWDQLQGLGGFPEELQWESMVDILRGKVKVHNHCYETVDLNSMILMTQEFGFPIAAFHHSHETYLIAEQLKTAFGGPPASALFAIHARYKRESYRGSEFAPSILHAAGIKVVMKSDHPVLNSRHLIYEAQQAHYYGLPLPVALASVTSTPAGVMGLEHRVGYVKKGWDADVVVWDSHPLALGATPRQVWIDGKAQIEKPYTTSKPESFQKAPEVPDWDNEAKEALKYEGLPPLAPKKRVASTVVFQNVSTLHIKDKGDGVHIFDVSDNLGSAGVLVVRAGHIVCSGSMACVADFKNGARGEEIEFVDLQGGAIGPGLTTFGSSLGQGEIQGEASTNDGPVFDPLLHAVPDLVGGTYGLDRAADGLMFGTRDALLAYLRGGVTAGIVAPQGRGLIKGLGAAFSTASENRLQKGAVGSEDAALHVRVSMASQASVSTQIAALRRLLLTKEPKGELDAAFKAVAHGERVLAIEVASADIMSSLLRLKKEVEEQSGERMKVTFVGAQEAHLLAKELGEAGVGVILAPYRPYPGTWETRRILAGPPLTEKGAVQTLVEAGVTVALGSNDASIARNTRLDVGWAAIEAGEALSKRQAYALASTNLEKLLGAKPSRELVATRGGDLLDAQARVVGVISPVRGVVDLI